MQDARTYLPLTFNQPYRKRDSANVPRKYISRRIMTTAEWVERQRRGRPYETTVDPTTLGEVLLRGFKEGA